ncbi:hypothetical protein Tco_0580468, partial [Tanacetum coccineum]
MALADDELFVGKNHPRNDEWIDITMKKVNILLSMDEDSDWQNYLKYINIDLNEQIPSQKKKCFGGEQLIETSSVSKAPTDTESSKDLELEPQTPLPLLKTLQGASPSSEILESKAKPFPPCTHCGFDDHHPDDCRNYPKCEI